MNNLTNPSQRYILLQLFHSVWIKRYFPLISQSCMFNKLLLSAEVEVFVQSTIENKEILSAKSLKSDIEPCVKLLT